MVAHRHCWMCLFKCITFSKGEKEKGREGQREKREKTRENLASFQRSEQASFPGTLAQSQACLSKTQSLARGQEYLVTINC